jgi:hypothetical protein
MGKKGDYTLLSERIFGFVFPDGCEVSGEAIEELYRQYLRHKGAKHPELWDKLISEVFAYGSVRNLDEVPFQRNAITAAITKMGNVKILYIGDLISQNPARVKRLMGQKSWEAVCWFMERHGLRFGTDVGEWRSDLLRSSL